MADDRRVAKTYIWHGDQCFFVSTIERDTSASIEPPAPRYAETIAWEFDWDNNERGATVYEGGCPKHLAVQEHMRVAENLSRRVIPAEDQEA